MATAKTKVRIYSADSNAWLFPTSIAHQFAPKGALEVRAIAAAE